MVLGRAHPHLVLSWLTASLASPRSLRPPPSGVVKCVGDGEWSNLPAARALDVLASLRSGAWAAIAPEVQGYLAHKKTPSPRTLQ